MSHVQELLKDEEEDEEEEERDSLQGEQHSYQSKRKSSPTYSSSSPSEVNPSVGRRSFVWKTNTEKRSNRKNPQIETIFNIQQ